MSNFKVRPRKPSILHFDDVNFDLDLPSDLNPDDDDDDVFLDSASIDIGVPEAGDEGTPLKVAKENERRTSLTEEKPLGKENTIHVKGTPKADNGKERSSSPLSSPPASDAEDGLSSPLKLTEENLIKLETVSSHAHEEDDGGDVSDDRTPAGPLPPGIEHWHESMLPPASSSSIQSPLRSSQIGGSEANEEGEESTGSQERVLKSTKPERTASTSKEQQQQRKPLGHLSTANLRERLLPQRKRRKILRERTTKKNTSDLISDEEQQNEFNNDEEGVSYMAATKSTRSRQKRRKVPAKQGSVQVKEHENAGSTNARATGKKGRRKTYGRSQPNEPEAAEASEADQTENDDDDNNTAEQGATNGANTQRMDEELAKQRKKFEEIWKWDMEFEDVPENEQDTVEISSPFR
ncbi:hypothetical protein KEM54_000951 [Ascosphaera aggregata]|nr:hypothetical protein KEM54_000951 [Ascosphaera aggregata]